MLRCLRNYRGVRDHRLIVLSEGARITDPELASWLNQDCPEAFEDLGAPVAEVAEVVETKAIDAAPADKMVRAPQVKKGARHGK